jgi:excisionase family DNA binding protein
VLASARRSKQVLKPQTAPSENKRLSVEHAAPILGVSTFTVRRWIRERRLAYHRVGRRIVLDRRDLEAFLRRCRVEAREP